MSAALKQTSSSEPKWLALIKGEALARFEKAGLPTQKDEDWKYTNLNSFKNLQFHEPTFQGQIDAQTMKSFEYIDAQRIVFVDGQFSPKWSQAKDQVGVSVQTFAEALTSNPELLKSVYEKSGNTFVDQNTVHAQSGYVVQIAKNTQVTKPIHIIHFTTENQVQTFSKNLVICEEGSKATILEESVAKGASVYFVSRVTHLHIQNQAQLTHIKLQNESESAFHVSHIRAKVENHGHYASHLFSLGGVLTRNDIEIVLNGKEASNDLQGLYAVHGSQVVDNRTYIDHAQPHCRSFQTYKGILGDQSRGIFNGRIMVRPGAVKTDAQQLNRNLLLSETAEVDSRPQLEILNDDVKCSHGAAIGKIDANQIFYMRTRGISESDARRILTRAFAEEQINKIQMAELRARIDSLLMNKGLMAEQ